MALELEQSLRLSQNLVMTPQLQQAIKLLQLNRMELAEHIMSELLENPMLEETPEELEAKQLQDQKDRIQEKEAQDADQPKEVDPQKGQGTDDINWENYL